MEDNLKNIVEVKKRNKLNRSFIAFLLCLFFALILITSFCIYNKFNDKIYKNVFLEQKNMSNMSMNDVQKYLESKNNQINSTVKIYEEKNLIKEVSSKDIDFEIDVNKTIEILSDYGRNQNTIINNWKIFKTLLKRKNIKISYKYSEPKLTDAINDIRSNIKGKAIDDSFFVNEKNYTLFITKGITGKDININNTKQNIINKLKTNLNTEYILNTEVRKPININVEDIYIQVKRDAKDAYIDRTTEDVKLVKQVVGLDFDKDKLRNILNENKNKIEGTKIEFKLDEIKPKVTLADIKWDLYEAKISSMTTNFKPSALNRSSNLKLGLSILDGTIVMPGDTFSFNQTMGDCGLASRGFKIAPVFIGGKVDQGIGGGVCQIASTLYNAALYANLDIVKRHQHGLPVSYIDPSLDATISYPYLDLKFTNNRKYPIKIVTSYNSSGKIIINIMGTLEEKEYDIELISKVKKTINSKTEYVNDNKMLKGETRIVSKGTNGLVSYAIKVTKLNGKEISRKILSEDTYLSVNTVMAIGTKEN